MYCNIANDFGQLIDPEENSIGYLAVLHTLLEAAPPSPPIDPALLDAILNFILKFNALQVRHAGAWLLSLLERIADGNLFSVGPPQQALFLRQCADPLVASGSCRTPWDGNPENRPRRLCADFNALTHGKDGV